MPGYITDVLENTTQEGNIYVSLPKYIPEYMGDISLQMIRIGTCSGMRVGNKRVSVEQALKNSLFRMRFNDGDYLFLKSMWKYSTIVNHDSSHVFEKVPAEKHTSLPTDQAARYIDGTIGHALSHPDILLAGLFGWSTDESRNYFETPLAMCIQKLIQTTSEGKHRVQLIGYYTQRCGDIQFNQVWNWLRDRQIHTIYDFISYVKALGESYNSFNPKFKLIA